MLALRPPQGRRGALHDVRTARKRGTRGQIARPRSRATRTRYGGSCHRSSSPELWGHQRPWRRSLPAAIPYRPTPPEESNGIQSLGLGADPIVRSTRHRHRAAALSSGVLSPRHLAPPPVGTEINGLSYRFQADEGEEC